MATQKQKDAGGVAAGGAVGAAAGASHKKAVLSPYKLYKHDMKRQRTPVTWGPKGKPYKGAAGKDMFGCSGSVCYQSKHVDWSMHRLAPAAIERTKPQSKTRRAIGKVTEKLGGGAEGRTRPGTTLKHTSPRWGPGEAPSRRPRKTVPIPTKASGVTNVSRSAKVAAGVAVGSAAVAGAHAVRDRGKRRH